MRQDDNYIVDVSVGKQSSSAGDDGHEGCPERLGWLGGLLLGQLGLLGGRVCGFVQRHCGGLVCCVSC